jgi:hypothetical protein
LTSKEVPLTTFLAWRRINTPVMVALTIVATPDRRETHA